MSEHIGHARPIFKVKVHPPEYIHVIDDILRLVIIQFIIQFMFFLNNPEDFPMLSAIFLSTVLYIIVGVAFYWLVVRKIILFV